MDRTYEEHRKLKEDMFLRCKLEPNIGAKPISNDMEERMKLLVKELKQRDDQYKELLNENERLENELREKANEFKILEFIAGGVAEDNAAMEKEIIEVYETNEELDRKLKWVDKNLTEKLIELNRYGKLVDDLMKVVDILSSRAEGDE